MTRLIFLLIIMLSQISCERDRSETITVKIEGKPVNLPYAYHLTRGNLSWTYQGEIEGKVGVCISECSIIVEEKFTINCPQVQILSGKFSIASNTGLFEGIKAGKQLCFVFVPEKGSKGIIHVKFTESKTGGW
ncbi:hypothetical protein SAMN04487995_3827 [Dyadobacter koreensis]|uniref:Uncharacterized protein n=1 Tax=Dyadobacter koreensis TaxID=408657 RepID=A0A1H6XAL7_9BACT|nr:hypothetical protein [Dyadobacter koreensis]SEJ26178.1 hypothetical protein SAMN04487995_3827 [Dyadobacter koreensis]